MSDKKRGFGSMSKERQSAIAALGGKAAHAQGRAHKFTVEKAREAGRKGGAAISQDREHMRRIGRLGAERRMANKLAREAMKADEVHTE